MRPKELTRAEIIRTATSFHWTRKMPKWRVVVNSREFPARPLVLEAAGVAPNNPTNSHQAVAILEGLGFETHYVKDSEPVNIETAKADRSEPIYKTILKLAEKVPDSEWSKLPRDLAINIDKYLYGKKRLDK